MIKPPFDPHDVVIDNHLMKAIFSDTISSSSRSVGRYGRLQVTEEHVTIPQEFYETVYEAQRLNLKIEIEDDQHFKHSRSTAIRVDIIR